MDKIFTIKSKSENISFKDKGSKFFSYCFFVQDEDQIKEILKNIKIEHYSASHLCYAWKIGYLENQKHKINDDGEPRGTAGQQIYNQILSFDLTDILVVSVRYFGGTKLGVTGLINAYRTSARLAIENAEIIEKKITKKYIFYGDYEQMNFIQRIIKENNLIICDQELKDKFKITVCIPVDIEKKVLEKVKLNHKIKF